MLDEMERAYFAHKMRHARERAASAADEKAALPFLELAAEYERKLDELSEPSYA
jgi:hypothetical protein